MTAVVPASIVLASMLLCLAPVRGEARASASTSGSGSANANASGSAGSERPMLKWAPERNMWELGLWVGLLVPNDEHEFYDPRVVAHQRYQRVAADVGLRFAYFPLRWLGGELEVGFMPTKTLADINALLYTVRGHAIFQLPWWRLTPFLVVGGGGMGVASSSLAQGDDIDASFHWGPGLKFYATRYLALRLDVRHLVGARVGLDDGATSHVEVLFGLSVTLGRKKKSNARTASGDPDGDGFYGKDDRCPDEAGTYPDGCPEADRDGDSIADEEDKCPDEPGVAPTGCPEPDRDGDGVGDAVDKCPAEPGSKPDGCPPDSDGDGVADPQDTCPDLAGDQPNGCPPDTDGDKVYDPEDECETKPETRNGYEDEDGCPDNLPKRLIGAAGVLPGITFETNSARITPSSRPTLDDAARVLKENPGYHLQVVGHTDNTGDYFYNVSLSQKRADAVKAYLVSKGVEEHRIQTRGVGPQDPVADNNTAAGRAENRRIEFRLRRRGGR